MTPNPVDGAPAAINARDQLRAPALLITLCGGLGALGALGLAGLTWLVQTAGAHTLGSLATDPRLAQFADPQSATADYLASAIWLVASGFLIFGAMKLRNVQSYGLAMGAAMVVMIPCGGCCCFGLPVGIWAVITLRKPEIKSQFS